MLLGNRETGKSSVHNNILRREEQPKIFTQRHIFFLLERMLCPRNITMANINTEIDQRWKCVVMDTEWIPFRSTKLWQGQGQDKTETEEKVVTENSINMIKRGAIYSKRLCDKFEERGGRIHFFQGLLGDLQPKTISTSIRMMQTLRFRPTLGE